MSSVKRKKRSRRGRSERRPSAVRSDNGAVRTPDTEEVRRASSARYSRARANQDAAERVRRRRRRRRRQSEVNPFYFKEVKKTRVKKPNDEKSGKRAERLYKFLITAAVLCIAVFVTCAFFEVHTVRAEGSSRYSSTEIAHYSGIETGKKMLFLNRRAAAEKILTELPYVKSVTIRKHFPSEAVIYVQERVPAAKIVDGIMSYIIDNEGYLLEYTVMGAAYDLPVIKCAPPAEFVCGKQLVFEDPLMLETMQNVLTHIVNSEWMAGIDFIDIEKIYSISFNYKKTLTVKLGDTTDIDMKLTLLNEVLKRNNGDMSGVVDISSTQRVSFQPKV